MDGSRFDDLVARLGAHASRRSIVRGMIGAGVGLAAPLTAGARHRKHHHHKSCTDNFDCPGQETCVKRGKHKRVCQLQVSCPSPDTFCKSAQFAGCCTADLPVCCAGTQLATCNAAGCVCDAQGFYSM